MSELIKLKSYLTYELSTFTLTQYRDCIIFYCINDFKGDAYGVCELLTHRNIQLIQVSAEVYDNMNQTMQQT